MQYREIDEFDGRKILRIEIDFSKEEQQSILNFLSASKATVKDVFKDRDEIELFVYNDAIRRVIVRAFPDLEHIVSKGFIYIGIFIEDLANLIDFENSFWLGKDEYEIWINDRDAIISSAIAVEVIVKNHGKYDCPYLYDLQLQRI